MNMIPVRFHKFLLETQIKLRGNNCDFYKMVENDYHVRVPDFDNPVQIKGIYYEQNAQETRTSGDAAITRTRPSPGLLCIWDELQGIQIDDRMCYDGRYYIVTAIDDMQNWHVFAQISLKEVPAWQEVGAG